MVPPQDVRGISLGEKMMYEKVRELRGLEVKVKTSSPSMTAWLRMEKCSPCSWLALSEWVLSPLRKRRAISLLEWFWSRIITAILQLSSTLEMLCWVKERMPIYRSLRKETQQWQATLAHLLGSQMKLTTMLDQKVLRTSRSKQLTPPTVTISLRANAYCRLLLRSYLRPRVMLQVSQLSAKELLQLAWSSKAAVAVQRGGYTTRSRGFGCWVGSGG